MLCLWLFLNSFNFFLIFDNQRRFLLNFFSFFFKLFNNLFSLFFLFWVILTICLFCNLLIISNLLLGHLFSDFYFCLSLLLSPLYNFCLCFISFLFNFLQLISHLSDLFAQIVSLSCELLCLLNHLFLIVNGLPSLWYRCFSSFNYFLPFRYLLLGCLDLAL